MKLFHLCAVSTWNQTGAEYRPASLESEGFVHLSTEAQWRLTAARFFRGQRALVLLEVDSDALGSGLRFERADGDEFPHLYGALPRSAVLGVTPLAVSDDGEVTMFSERTELLGSRG